MKSITLDQASATTTKSATPSKNWLLTTFEGFRQRAADRAVRRQLASMDDTLLRDIGVAEDEIWRIRRGESSPRAPGAAARALIAPTVVTPMGNQRQRRPSGQNVVTFEMKTRGPKGRGHFRRLRRQ